MADQDLNIKISTEVQLTALRELQTSLEKQIATARALGTTGSDSYKNLVASLTSVREKLGTFTMGDKIKTELSGLAQSIPGVSQAFSLLNGSMLSLAGAAGVVVSALKYCSESLREFEKAEKVTAKLDAALANSGQYTQEYSARVRELASSMEHATGIASGEWTAALTRLTQFGANETNIEQYAQAVANLAGILDGDIQGAAVAFSRAMQGNFAMFSRYGIILDENASKTEKLNQLQQELAKRGANQLGISVTTLSGAWTKMHNASSTTMEGVGAAVSRFIHLKEIVLMAATGMEKLAEKVSVFMPKTAGLKNTIDGAATSMDELAENTETAAQKLDRITAQAVQAVADAAGKAADNFSRARIEMEGLNALALKRLDLEEQIALAELDKRTDLDPVEKLKAQQQIQQDSIVRKRAEQNRADQARMQSLGEERGNATGLANTKFYQVDSAQKSVEAAKAEIERLQNQKKLRQQLIESQKEAEENISSLGPGLTKKLLKAVFSGNGTAEIPGLLSGIPQVRKKVIEGELKNIEQIKKQLETLGPDNTEKTEEAKATLKAAQAALKIAQDVYDKAKSLRDETVLRVDSELLKLRTGKATRTALAPEEDKLTGLKNDKAVDAVTTEQKIKALEDKIKIAESKGESTLKLKTDLIYAKLPAGATDLDRQAADAEADMLKQEVQKKAAEEEARRLREKLLKSPLSLQKRGYHTGDGTQPGLDSGPNAQADASKLSAKEEEVNNFVADFAKNPTSGSYERLMAMFATMIEIQKRTSQNFEANKRQEEALKADVERLKQISHLQKP